MRTLLCLLLFSVAALAQQTTITGTFRNPDGSSVNGKVTIQLLRNAIVTNTCSTPAQVISFTQLTRSITNSIMAPLQLYPNTCFVPSQNYLVYVYDSNNKQLYKGQWLVPQQSVADVTEISYVSN